MQIIAIKVLRDFWEHYPDSERPLKEWYKFVSNAEWKNANEVKQHYGNASLLQNDRICFNISGNKYRLIVKCQYSIKQVYIRFIGTHRAYDKIDAHTI